MPLEVTRKGRRLRVMPPDQLSKLDRVIAHHDYLASNPDDVIHIDWSGEWRP
ncbi:MAG: hypothetical protein ACRDGF_00485 [Chloroflexota bacterium]